MEGLPSVLAHSEGGTVPFLPIQTSQIIVTLAPVAYQSYFCIFYVNNGVNFVCFEFERQKQLSRNPARFFPLFTYVL